jgi:hypothetical protein
MAVWELIRDAMQSAHERGRDWLPVGEITREVHAIDQAVNRGTIHAYVRYLCINDPSKKHSAAPLYRTNPLFVTDDPTMHGKRYRLLTEDERLAFLSNPTDDLDKFTYARVVDLLGCGPEAGGRPSPPSGGRKEEAATTPRAQTTIAGLLRDVLLLIPCCAEKHGTGPSPQTMPTALAEELSTSSRTLLQEGRKLAFSRPGTSLDVASLLLPAITWYTGRPYSVPGFHEALNRALERGLRCLVISGGYGLLRLDEPIHSYQAQMARTRTVWRVRLPTILRDYVTRNDVRRVFGALSAAYHDAIGPGRWGPLEADTWWYVPRFRRGIDAGSPMREVPLAVGQAVIDLVELDFVPGPGWQHQ